MRIIKPADLKEYYFEERCFITELLNQPEVPSISIASARVEAGTTTVLHALKGLEVYYILAGKGQVEVEDKFEEVVKGDLVHIPPNEPQRITNTGTADLIFLAICSPRFIPEDYTDLEK
ncbi:MAG: cupin domain-containing protein [Bacteroidota bacterium]